MDLELCLECLSLFVLQMDVRIKSNYIMCNLFTFYFKKHSHTLTHSLTYLCATREWWWESPKTFKWNWSLWVWIGVVVVVTK